MREEERERGERGEGGRKKEGVYIPHCNRGSKFNRTKYKYLTIYEISVFFSVKPVYMFATVLPYNCCVCHRFPGRYSVTPTTLQSRDPDSPPLQCRGREVRGRGSHGPPDGARG